MDENEWLAGHFEEHRAHLRAVAYRMLGSLAEADDAVQDTWLRLSRSGAGEVENLGGWLTTIVARVCLNMLRARSHRREEPVPVHLPDAVISPDGELQPEEQALLADSVGLALLVVLDTLTPDERLVFVLHDLFDLPFGEIGPLVGRTRRRPSSSPAGHVAGCRGPRYLPPPTPPATAAGRRRLLRRSPPGRLRRARRGASPRRPCGSTRAPVTPGLDADPRPGSGRQAGGQGTGRCWAARPPGCAPSWSTDRPEWSSPWTASRSP